MIDLERRSTNALSFLIALVSARRKRVRDIDLRGKGSPLLHSCRVSRGKMPPVITALAGICIGKLRIKMRARAIGPIPTAFPNPVTALSFCFFYRNALTNLFLLCFSRQRAPLCAESIIGFINGKTERKCDYIQPFQRSSGFWKIKKEDSFNKSYLQSVSSIRKLREITFLEKKKYNINEKRTRITHINCLNVILNKLLSCSRREYLGARKRLKRRRLWGEKNLVDWWRKYLKGK